MHTVTTRDTTQPQTKNRFAHGTDAHLFARATKHAWPNLEVTVTNDHGVAMEIQQNGWSKVTVTDDEGQTVTIREESQCTQ